MFLMILLQMVTSHLAGRAQLVIAITKPSIRFRTIIDGLDIAPLVQTADWIKAKTRTSSDQLNLKHHDKNFFFFYIKCCLRNTSDLFPTF